MRGMHAARAALLVVSVGAAGVAAAEQPALPPQLVPAVAASLTEFGEARMPSGMMNLCAREPDFCRPVTASAERTALSPERWRMLSTVNGMINRQIFSTTDEKLYGQVEFWTLPRIAGDCEDYVLLKRQALVALGWPEASLLITVVQDENGEGHAVLSIPTTSGDLVLDNRRDEILHWQATGYKFVKRQSSANPNVWVSLAREKLQATNMASAPEAP